MSGWEEGFAKLGVRLASALVFGVVFLAAVLFGGPLGLGALLSAAAGLAAAELCRLLPGATRGSVALGGIGAAALPLAAGAGASSMVAAGEPAGVSTAAVLVAVAAMAVFVPALLLWLAAAVGSTATGAASAALAVAWVGLGLAHLVFLQGLEGGGPGLALVAVLGVWAGDVAGYVIGVAIGRHKLAPRLSPGKSWEGFAAGLLATVGAWVGFAAFLALPQPAVLMAAVGVAAALAGLLGDLAESRVKRLAGVKDSGTLIPGHGGVLDRFDSLITVSVVTFWILSLGGSP
ncbi:MAG: phosphatidate cytidylyltransferase [Coriobacteriia bacterium]|nr:phosphatidate cytidylyltransferase [Coriobacteriia bacterium]